MYYSELATKLRRLPRPIWLALGTAFFGGAIATSVSAKSSVSYIPGLTVVPEVVTRDGVTDRTYNTPQGSSLWRDNLPVLQGDKVKLNVFAATGGADLKQVIIRLDNTRLPGMPLTALPWSTVLDTATMPTGYHMVEVWAQASGDKPQSTTKTLTFFVTKQIDAKYLVQGTQQILTNGTVTNVPLENGPTLPAAEPLPPDFLQGQPTDPDATVTISTRAAASDAATRAVPVGDGTVTINEPTLFLVQPAPGSTVKQFAYSLVRGGVAFNSATKPLPVSYQVIRISKRTDSQAGLRPGLVTMWVWGIDAQGHPSAPVKTQINIP